MAGILDRAAADINKVTKAQDNQEKSAKRVAAATTTHQKGVDELSKSYKDYVANLEKGNRSTDEATDHLKRFSAEFAKLSRRAPVGSQMAEDMLKASKAAQKLIDDINALEVDYKKRADSIIATSKKQLDATVKDIDSRVKAEKKGAADQAAAVEALARQRIVAEQAAAEEVRKAEEKLQKARAAAIIATAKQQLASFQQELKQRVDGEKKAAAEIGAAQQKLSAQRAAAEHEAEAAAERLAAAERKLAADVEGARGRDALATLKQQHAQANLRQEVEDSVRAYDDFIDRVRQGGVAGRDVEAGLKQHASNLNRLAGRSEPGSAQALSAAGGAAEAKDLIKSLGQEAEKAERSTNGLTGALHRLFSVDPEKIDRIESQIEGLEASLGRGSFSAIRFAGTLRSLVYVGVFVFFQELTSAAIALAGALVSVASAAIQAGGFLAGALASGAAQAIPVIGLLGAAWGRVGAVFRAVQQHIKDQTTAVYDNTQATKAQGQAASAVVAAQEALNKARADGVRQIQDLTAAERQARFEAESAALAQGNAQLALQRAFSGGDVGSLAELSIQSRRSSFDLDQANVRSSRASTDASTARAQGVEGLPSVVAAKRALDDAKSSAVDAGAKTTAAQRQLQDMLAQLSPAERRLYDSLNKLYDRYRKIFVGDGKKSGLLGTIVDAFTFGVDRLYDLLGNKRLIKAAEDLADQIGGSLRRLFAFLTSEGSVNFIEQIADQAKKNLPVVEDILERIVTLFERIASAASPAFSTFLHFIDDLFVKGDKATRRGSGFDKLRQFFDKGEKYAESFVKLAGAIAGLVGAIVGVSAPQGGNVIDSITIAINKATDWIRDNRDDVKQFFSDAIDASASIARTIGKLATELFSLFNADNVKDFANALTTTVIPALGQVARTIGRAAQIFTDLVDSGPGSTFAKFLIITLLLQGTLGKLASLILRFGRSFAALLGAEGAVGLFNTLIRLSGPVGLVIIGLTTAIGLLSGHIDSLGDAIKYIASTLGLILITIYGSRGLKAGLLLVYEGLQSVAGATLAGKLGLIGTAFGTILTNVLNLIKKLPILRGLLNTQQGPIIVNSEGKTPGGVIVSGRGTKTAAGATEGAAITGAEAAAGAGGIAAASKVGIGAIGKIALPIAALTALFTFLDTHGSVVDRIQAVASSFTFGLIPGPNKKGAPNATAGNVNQGIVNLLTPSTGALVQGGQVQRFAIPTKSIADIKKAIDDQLKNKDGDPYILDRLFGKDFESATRDQLNAALKQVETFGPKYQRIINFLPKIREALGQVRAKDILDPQAAAELSSNIARMQVAGVRGLGDLKNNVQINLDLIGQAFTQGSDSWKDALTKSYETAIDAAIKAGLNKTKAGMKEIRGLFEDEFALYGFSKEEANNLLKGQSATGGPEEGTAGPSGHPTRPRVPGAAGGGWIGKQGQRGADNVLRWLGKGEAVLNWAHQKVVDPAMQMMYGYGLNDLFRRSSGEHGTPVTGGMAAGGPAGSGLFDGHPSNVNNSVRKLIETLKGKFPLTVTSTTDHSRLTTSGNVSDHSAGNAVDIAGATDVMYRAAQYVKSSGIFRSLKQGIHNPNLSVNLGKLVSPSFWGGDWTAHTTHLHLAIIGALNAAATAAKKIPRANLGISGALGAILQRGTNRVRNMANRVLGIAATSSTSSPDSSAGIPTFTGPWVGVMEKIAENMRWNVDDWRWVIGHESGGRVSAKNPTSTAFGLGQLLDSTYAKYGGGPGSTGAEQIRAMAGYIRDRYHDPTRAKSFWQAHNYYAKGGEVLGKLGQAVPIMAHAGEWVVNQLQQSKIARLLGTSVSSLRGAMGFSGGKGSYAGGGNVQAYVQSNKPATVPNLTNELDRADSIISALGTSIINKKFTDKLSKSFTALLGDGGVFDQMTQAISDFSDTLAANLSRLTFKVNAAGNVVKRLSDQQIADKTLANLQNVGSRLQVEGAALEHQLGEVASRLSQGGLSRIRKAYLQTIQTNLEKRLTAVNKAVADNLSTTFQAVEDAITSRVDSAQSKADQANVTTGIQARLRAVLGTVGSAALGLPTSGAIGRTNAQTLTDQADDLQDAANYARKHGHNDTYKQILNQISDLRTQALEAVKASLESDAQDITDDAARQNTKADLQDRLATVLEAAGNTAGAFALRGTTLASRGSTLTSEYDRLKALQVQAQGLGQTQVVQDLQDKLDDLNVSIQENSEAVKDNTTAARNAAIAAITGRSSFLTSTFGGLGGIFTGLGNLPGGTVDVNAQESIIQHTIGVLTGTGSSLLQTLFEGFGIDLRGLDPGALAKALLGLNYDGIEANLSPADKESFESLIGSIIGNTGAIVDNTSQLAQLTGTPTQTFSSTAWAMFRMAIFNGSNGLLSQFAGSVPRFDNGGVMPWTGLAHLRAGEIVVNPSRGQGVGGDGATYNLNVTTPTQVLDPTDVNRQLGFFMKHGVGMPETP